jgi:hypothetical protein
MAKSLETEQNINRSQPSGSSKGWIFIIPLLAVIALVWLILLRIDMLPESLAFNQDFKTWVNIWMVILIILIIVLILIIPHGSEKAAPVEVVLSTKPSGTKKVKKQVKHKPVTMETVDSDAEPVEFVPVKKQKVKRSAKKSGEILIDSDILKQKSSIVDAEAQADRASAKSAEIIAPPAKKGKIKPSIIEYPSEVEGGIYGDTFIEIDQDDTLKLRTLVVEDIYLL